MTVQDYMMRPEPGICKVLIYSRKKHLLEVCDTYELPDRPSRTLSPLADPAPGTLCAPIKLFIACTRKCDLNCPMCFAVRKHCSQPEMSTETISRIITQAAYMGVFEIRFTGGEPTLHPHFFDLIGLVNRNGMNISLSTHGAYHPRLLKRMIASPIDDFRISIDGLEDVHDSLRGKGAFRRTVTAVRELRSTGRTVRINTMVYRGNIDVLGQLAELAHELNVQIRFCPLRAIGRAMGTPFADRNVLSPDEWCEIRNRFSQPGWQEQGVLCFSVEDNQNFESCKGPGAGFEECKCSPYLTQMGIDPEGEAYAGGCTDAIAKTLSVGSVSKHPLSILWVRAQQDVFDRILSRYPECVACAPEEILEDWMRELANKPRQSRHIY
jgi:MoaA/NifB/PqqE/SkfB family radical SAM enzyme